MSLVEIESALDALRRCIRAEDYAEQAEAMTAAEDALLRAGSEAVPALIDALKDDAWGVIMGAVYVLGELRDVRAVQPLIERLAHSDDHVQHAIADALLKIGSITVRPLIHALRGHEDGRVRRAAAGILGVFRDPLATPALLNALAEDTPEVRAAAAASLGSTADVSAVEGLIWALENDESAAVREAAARALGVIALGVSVPRALPALAAALDDSDWGTRQSAAEMLARLGAPERLRALELLVRDTAHPDPEIRLGAAWSLLQVRDAPSERDRAVDALTRLLYAPQTAIAASAALALGEAGDPRPIPALRAALAHVDTEVRHAAQAALERLQAGVQ